MLLNIDGQGFESYPGDEYVPPAYKQLNLPTHLYSIRSHLFGPSPDRVMLNYRARQYLALLHATELGEFLTELDSRVTYDIGFRDEFFDSLFSFNVKPVGGTTKELFLVDQPDAPDAIGRLFHSFNVRVLSGSTVDVTRHTPPPHSGTQEYTLSSGLSSLVTLTGSGLRCRFEDGIGSEWVVEGYARPRQSLGVISRGLEGIADGSLIELFQIGSPAGASEPFKTFRNLWEKHHELAFKLGGLLLAIIYQTEEIRTQHAS